MEEAANPRRDFYTPVLLVLLAACIVRLWLSLLSESFWLDETLTAFVVRHGAGDPSLAAAPGVDQSVYYWLPRVSQAFFGFSEFSLRLPSLAVTMVSLFLIWRLAARFIHAQAGWVAVFLCFIPHEFTRQATDARPYGLGTCVALAGIWFLVRWLDEGAWRDAVLFVLFAALLLRVHLMYWPFYAVFGCYAAIRWMREETRVSGRGIAAVLAIVAGSLVPLVPATLALFGNANKHIVTELPTLKNIFSGFQIAMVAGSAALWFFAKLFRWPRERLRISASGVFLLLTWWLWQPTFLLMVSWLTGNSVFLARYFSVALPGAMLTSALAAGYFIPGRAWKPVALAMSLCILALSFRKPPTRNSHWREAARAVNDMVRNSGTPVVCPSPFVEARNPVWTPGYRLPGFLYAYLDVYPIEGATILLPRLVDDGEQYARSLLQKNAAPPGRFVIYGGEYGANLWTPWFAAQPEFAGWHSRQVGSFGDVEVVLFEKR